VIAPKLEIKKPKLIGSGKLKGGKLESKKPKLENGISINRNLKI
jgi:hypothetical protein